MNAAYPKSWFDRMGLVSLLETGNASCLLHEPPDAERHVRWCGGRRE